MTTLNTGSTMPTVESAKVEDVDSSSEEGMPGLQPAQATQEAGASGQGASAQAKPTVGKGQSRAEKKSRKAVQRLGMKPFPGIVSVKVKKGKGVCLPICPSSVSHL
jgi:nascent polypeptide-associated complex subunit alpha